VGLFFRDWVWPLSSSEILDNFMLPSLWEQFCSCSNMTAPVHKARTIQLWMSEFGLEELDWSAQSPNLKLIGHLWDELEWRQRMRF